MLREGHGVEFFSALMACWVFRAGLSFQEGFSLSPLGETGEGFVLKAGKMSEPCQSKTSSPVNVSPKKNFNATPSALSGTSPKYGKLKSECGFKIHIVGFGGGRVGVDFYCHKSALVIEVDGDIQDLQQEEDARREKALSALGLRTCAEPVEALSVLGMMRL